MSSINQSHSGNSESPELKPHHLQELHGAGISDEIIRRNFRSIEDPQEVDSLLNRNSRRRWQHSDALVPGWLVTGIDPVTEEHSGLGIQYKPDVAPVDVEGKAQKYLGASAQDTAPLFLDAGEAGFWEWFKGDISADITVVEGAKKSGCILSLSDAAISIPGVWNFGKKGRLHKLLVPFCKPGRKIYIAYDADWKVKPDVCRALKEFGRILKGCGCTIGIVVWELEQGKGIDDYLMGFSEPERSMEWDRLKAEALTYGEWLAEIPVEDKTEAPCKTIKALEKARELIKSDLAFNELSQRAEYQGVAIDRYKVFCAEKLNIDLQRDSAVEILEQVAIENRSYHPVNEFLDDCYAEFGDSSVPLLDNAIERYTGIRNPLYESFFRHWLISGVQRVKHPGIFTKCVLVLKSRKQSLGKSSFLRILAHDEDWFSDSPNTGKDEALVNHQKWIIEWSECAKRMTNDDSERIKQYISSPKDDFRKPYGVHPVSMKRRFILGATTNESEFLNDRTGNVRFWVLDLDGCEGINLALLQSEVRLLWAAAVALYEQGETWDLSEAEIQQSEEINKQFLSRDPWLQPIEEFLETDPSIYVEDGASFVTVQQLLQKALLIEPGRSTAKESKRVEACLRDLGWQSFGRPKRIRSYGTAPCRPWTFNPNCSGDDRSISTATAPLHPTATPSNPCIPSFSEECSGSSGNNESRVESAEMYAFYSQGEEGGGSVGSIYDSAESTVTTATVGQTSCPTTLSPRSGGCNSGVTVSRSAELPLRVGAIVTYHGTKFPDLNSGQHLTLRSYNQGMWTVVKPDGRFSTWLYPEDLELVQEVQP